MSRKPKKKKPLTRGQRVIAFIEKWLLVPEGKNVGKPLKLDKFQKKFILAIYDNNRKTRRAILSMARKNGKTVLIAAILLAHLVGPEARENSQIVSGAQSRDQAALVFDLACKMIILSEELSDIIRIVPSSKRLIGLPMNVEYKALAAESKTAHGLSPVLAILDEIGQIRGSRDEFVDAITTSQGAHEDPLLIAISTQAANDADLFSVWIDDAINSKDPRVVCHVYAAPDDCSLLDKKAWAAANPALGSFRSLADMEGLAVQAQRMPSSENSFRNLNLNQRISTNSPFISREVWKQNKAQPFPIEEAEAVYGGLDLSSRADLTALVLIGIKGEQVGVYPYFWTPKKTLAARAKRDRAPYDLWVKQEHMIATPGATIGYDWVASAIAEITGPLTNLVAIGYDRWRIEILKKEFERIGIELPLLEWGQGFKDMSPAVEALEEYLLNKRILHGDNPVLNMCAVNAVLTSDPAGNRKIDKEEATGRMDGMVALAIAAGVATRKHESNDLDGFLSDPLKS